jgi:hypothetical protein
MVSMKIYADTCAMPLNDDLLRRLYVQLGVVDTICFINQLVLGDGDYTQERQELLQDWKLDDIFDALQTRPRR